MKRVIFFILISFSATYSITAQERDFERLNAFKIGFFTKRLNLTGGEAERFWPVYNEYQEQRNRIQAEKMALIRNFNQNEGNLSDNQTSELGDKLIAAIVKESELAVTLHKKLKEVLPPAKVIRFYQAENQYKAQLLNELQNRQQNRIQNRPLQNRQLPVR